MAAVQEASPTGLTCAQAQSNLLRDGPNELSRERGSSWLRLLAEVLREPMFVLLLSCAALYRLIGDPHDAIVLASFVVIVIAVSAVQQRRTDKALSALRGLGSPRALVIRDACATRIAGREVVVDDVLVLTEGDRVAADGDIVQSTDLLLDESILTGESAPELKLLDATPPLQVAALEAGAPKVYAGTLVVGGRGLARVTAIGAATRFGQIGRSLARVTRVETPLQLEIQRLVRRFSVIGLALCALVAIAYGLLRGEWVNGILAGLTLAMALLPEEFPVILSIYLALGAWRLARLGVLTRRLPAIEALGSVTVLCVDKTGTLTGNRMQVRCLASERQRIDVDGAAGADLPEEFHALVEYAILAGQSEPFEPMELAIKSFGESTLRGTEHLHAPWVASREYSLSPVLLAVTRAYRPHVNRPYVAAAKGAPEAIIDLCHLPPGQAGAIEAQARRIAAEGLRVIAVAMAETDAPRLPDRQHEFEFSYLGLIGYADPLRDSARAAVADCRRAGVRLIMLTGDYPETARAIARQAGIDAPDQVCSGPELRALSEERLREVVRSTQVFARVMPDQKLRLVEALQANGEVVAMTGDGVNDAPALRRAHVGIAMGQRGTDVARESASLVLTDDNFASIVQAIRHGRRIFANIRKASTYVLAIHLPIAALTLLPVLFGWPLILLPFHVAILHMVIDPACSIVIEAEPDDADSMAHPPRSARSAMLDARTLAWGGWQGAIVASACLAAFAWASSIGASEASARTLTFATLLLLNGLLIVSNRDRRAGLLGLLVTQSRAGWIVCAAIAVATVTLLSGEPWLAQFRLAPIPAFGLPAIAAAVLASALCIELGKAQMGRHCAPG